MDPASKSTLKIIGVVAIVAMVGAFGYNSMRKNSLEQTGRVYEQEQTAFDIPCGGASNISSINVSNGDCSSVTCSNGTTGNLPPGAGDGSITELEATGCEVPYQGNVGNASYTIESAYSAGCLIGACMSEVADGSYLNQTGKDDQTTGTSGGVKQKPIR